MFKDIISNQEGQNLFPGLPTYIKGAPGATPITMKNTKPQIALTKYGATQMMPGMEYAFPGNGVLEIPTAQMGGSQQDQIMQLIVAYAKKKNQDPKQLIAQLQQLPKDQQAQSIQAIMQDMQQDQGMAMAKDGGCIDCQEAYPQAQNLNWFYKAQGGTAFPAANMYPESWVGYNGTAYKFGGEEVYPQAAEFPPYTKNVETTPNFMVEYGGQTLDEIYQKMKAGGLNFDAKKKKGGELSKETFAQYIQRNGGNLPKHQVTGQTSTPGSYKDFIGGVPQDDEFSMMPSFIEEPKQEVSMDGVDQLMDNPWENAKGFAGRLERRYQREQDKLATSSSTKKSAPQKRRSNPYEYGFTTPEAIAVIGQSSQSPFLKRLAAGINIGSAFNTLAGDPLRLDRPIMSIGGDPWWSSSDNPMNQYIQKKAQEEANKQVPIATFNQTTTGTDVTGGMPSADAKAIDLDPNKNAINQRQAKTRRIGDIEGSARMVGALGAAGSLLEEANRIEEMEKLKGRVNTTDMAYQPVKNIDRGDYLTNVTQGTAFRPDQMQYAQKEAGYTEQSPLFYGKMGGDIMSMLQDGAEIDLDMYDQDTQNKIIQAIYAMGGSIEYI